MWDWATKTWINFLSDKERIEIDAIFDRLHKRERIKELKVFCVGYGDMFKYEVLESFCKVCNQGKTYEII